MCRFIVLNVFCCYIAAAETDPALHLMQTRAELSSPAHPHATGENHHGADKKHAHTDAKHHHGAKHVHTEALLTVDTISADVAVVAEAHAASSLSEETRRLARPADHTVLSEVAAVEATAEPKPSQSGLMKAYFVALIGMIVVVTAMFYSMGAAVVCQVVLYVSCLAFVKIAMKEVYLMNFQYAKFITALHLLTSSVAGFSVLAYRKFSAGTPIATPTKDELLYGILPIALTFGLSIGSENSALVFVSAAFSEVVAASNPVMSAFLTWACGMTFQLKLLAPIAVVVFGCIVSISGEISFSSFGLGLLLFSVFCRGLKAVMQQKLMTGEMKEKFDPCTLMAWTCLYCFIEMVFYSAVTEGMAPINALRAAPDLVGLCVAIALSAAIACTLNISALYVIKQLGAVGMQMVSQMKSLLVVIGGMALLDESFTVTQQIGFATVLSGVYWYSQMKRELDPNAKGH